MGALSVRMDNTDNIDAETLSVARLSADILEESRIGAILTHGDPDGMGRNTLAGVDFQYQNSSIFNRGRFLADIFYQRSFSNDIHGPAAGKDDDMFGFFLGYPNDLLRWFISGKEIGERFEPALGFVNRRDIRDYNGDYVRRKRFRDSWVQWWEGGVVGNIVTDPDNDIETHKFTLVTAFQNQIGDEYKFQASNLREVINQPFLIAGELPVPVGDYHFNQFDISLVASRSRRVIAELAVTCCRFYDGDYLGLNNSVEFRLSKHFRLTATHNMEKFDLPAGKLTVHIGSLDSSINFTPDMQIDTQMQYDNISERFSFSARYRWFPRPETEVFIAVGQTADMKSSRFPGHFDADRRRSPSGWGIRSGSDPIDLLEVSSYCQTESARPGVGDLGIAGVSRHVEPDDAVIRVEQVVDETGNRPFITGVGPTEADIDNGVTLNFMGREVPGVMEHFGAKGAVHLRREVAETRIPVIADKSRCLELRGERRPRIPG